MKMLNKMKIHFISTPKLSDAAFLIVYRRMDTSMLNRSLLSGIPGS